MPSARTARPALQAPDLLATLPACSGRRQNHPCRRHHECKLDDQTRDDADKEPREERSCGRSQTSLYNETRTHLALDKVLSPVMLIAMAAGAIADMHDRRVVGMVALAISLSGAIALTVLTWLHLMTPNALLGFC